MKISNIVKYMNSKEIKEVYYNFNYHETDKIDLMNKIKELEENIYINLNCTITINYKYNEIEFDFYVQHKDLLSFNITNKDLFKFFEKKEFIQNIHDVNNYEINILAYKTAILSFKHDECNNIRVETEEIRA